MEYAIEISNLVKRYPTTSNRDFVGIPHGPGSRGNVGNINALFEVIRGSRGPFIEALKSVNLKIKTGEIFGILGPNGAGKTTTIRMLTGISIHIDGTAKIMG